MQSEIQEIKYQFIIICIIFNIKLVLENGAEFMRKTFLKYNKH